MGININNNSSISSLFSSLGSSGSSGLSSFLGDYASIKNGSYGRLMKAYYGKNGSSGIASSGSKTAGTNNVLDKIFEEKRNPKVSKDVEEANANLTTGLSTMKTSVAALQKSSTYEDTENGATAASKVLNAVKAYVSDYNDVVNAAKGSTLSGKTAYVANMMSATAASADQLAEIGIKVNANGTLELNEGTLKTADISKVQDMFSSENVMSYGSKIASRLKFAGSAATGSATGSKETADTTDKATAGSAAAGLKADGTALASDELYAKVKDKDGNETDKYDVDGIFAKAKSFVNNYNKMFEVAESGSNSGVVANLSYIRQKTAQNANALKQLGISVDQKGQMSIDEDTFKKADMSQVQKVFKDYGSSIATNASLVDYYMTTQANAADGYTSAGAYNVQNNSHYAGTV